MLFLLKIVAIAALGYLGQNLLPWWSVAVAAFIVGALIPSKSVNSFLSGFLGIGLLWMVFAWVLDLEAGSIISRRVAPLLSFERPAAIMLFTGLIGAIVGGMSALSGDLLRKYLKRRKSDIYY